MDDEDRRDYRKRLCEGRDAAQDAYDRAVLSVSAGALAIALGFVKAAGSPSSKWLLATACLLLAASLLSVIWSFWFSRKSFDAQLAALDDTLDAGRVHRDPPGGRSAAWTDRLNVAAFACLGSGILALAALVVLDLGGKP